MHFPVSSFSDRIPLNNGEGIPCLGFGTYKTTGAETTRAVTAALEQGYQLIDTASYYGNEADIKPAIRFLPRDSFFLTTKLWNTDRGYERARAACEESLDRLGVQYLDLYLIHWPANEKQFGAEANSLNAETWNALEDLYAEEKVRAIGVCNFKPHHLETLLKSARIKPAVNQIEIHPGRAQAETVRYCQDHDIVVEAWSPLGRQRGFDNEVLTSIAAAHGKSVAQVCLRWEIQNGVVPIPKTVSPDRMRENRDVFDFVLTDEEMHQIDTLPFLGGKIQDPDEIDF